MEVENLQPGQEYKFRVMAVNAEGESEPLDADKSIIAKNPYGECIYFIRLRWNICFILYFVFQVSTFLKMGYISSDIFLHNYLLKYYSLLLGK